jgi:hypothetical protein
MALMTGTKAGILWFGKELGLERDERGVEPWANGDESLRACRDEVRDDVIILPIWNRIDEPPLSDDDLTGGGAIRSISNFSFSGELDLAPSPSDLNPEEDSTFGNIVSSFDRLFSFFSESNEALLSLVSGMIESNTELFPSPDPELFS